MPKKIQKSQRKAANGEGSVFAHGKKWRAQITIKNLDGTSATKTRTRDTYSAAKAALAELIAERDAFASPQTMTLGELLLAWLTQEVVNRAKNTQNSYRDEISKRIVPHIGAIRLVDLRPFHVSTWLTQIADCGARTRNNAFSVLSTGIEWGRRMGMIGTNPCGLVDKPARDPVEIEPFTAEETSQILDHVKNDRLHAAYILGLTMGLRQGEIFGLQWSDVNWKAKTLRICRQACEVRGSVSLTDVKTKASRRTISLSTIALESLVARKAAAMREGNASNDLIFCGARGAIQQRSNFGNRQWRSVLRSLGLKHRGFHHARHTAACLLLTGGVPLHVVSRILGHARPSVTLDLYSHVLDGQQTEAAETVSRLIAGY